MIKKADISRPQLVALLNAAQASGKSVTWVAEQLGVTRRTVENYIVLYGLQREWK